LPIRLRIRQGFFADREFLELVVSAEEDFTELVRRAKALDPEAVERLWKECGPSVMKAINRRVGRQTARFDAGDVAQAVWLTFYRNIGKLPDVQSQGDLVKYLEATAANKVRMEYRKHVASRRRSVDREVALDSQSTPMLAETASQRSAGGTSPGCTVGDRRALPG
jgi:DNA-directed RNA polymerase specialized sigma24 family protein